jgi:hypothetical protein
MNEKTRDRKAEEVQPLVTKDRRFPYTRCVVLWEVLFPKVLYEIEVSFPYALLRQCEINDNIIWNNNSQGYSPRV